MVAATDYLQLMTNKVGNQNDELGYISRRLKVHAGDNDISWIAASQLNRKVEQRENKRPILPDLRDSGNLEQDADIVIMLYRDYLYNPTVHNEGLAEMLVRKNRHGPIADMVIRFDSATMKFYCDEELDYG
jgi:replicative DNA helicase